jgi:protein-tyrosine phosphatase
MRAQGVVLLALLVEDEELERWSDPNLVAIGSAAGVDVRRYPIPDGRAPAHDLMARIQADIQAARARGDVAVACMGGVGRTGTVAACALVGAGLDAESAIQRVRQVRHPEAVETAEQERFVRAYAERASLERDSA